MSSPKICPIMSGPLNDPYSQVPADSSYLYDVPCQKENCAWWHDDACAAVLIAANLNAVALNYT